MTNKQIAMVYIANRLWGWNPDYAELRDISGTKLTEDRCGEICDEIGEIVDKFRDPLVKRLTDAGIEMV